MTAGSANLITLEVSIHAPLAGRDVLAQRADALSKGFNPRAPRGARPAHARVLVGPLGVSIHAPLAGRDGSVARLGFHDLGFNPRAPRGARLVAESVRLPAKVFQSTRPSRGATCALETRDRMSEFQSTRPSRGATRGRALKVAGRLGFNPRAPRGARQLPDGLSVGGSLVSIHAPLAGRDRHAQG